MKNEITYHWGEQQLLIDLGNRIQTRIRILFLAEFLLTTGLATVFLLQALPIAGSLPHWVAFIGSALIYPLAAYRFLSRVFFRERLLIDPSGLTIIQRTPFYQHSGFYDWKRMGAIHYAGNHRKTDHPLKGGCYDYFGFDTQERLTQSLHHNGNLYFYYHDLQVHFARGVYSWDAEKMIYMMRIFAGATLRLGPEWEQMLQEHEMDY